MIVSDNFPEKKVTVSEIASAADVSPATVSRVINQKAPVKEKTRLKVLNVMKELGYPLPDPVTIKNTQRTGVILINIPSLNNPFYGAIIKGIRAALSRHNYSAFINEGHINSSTIDNLIKTIRENKIVGLIVMNHVDSELLLRLSKEVCVLQCCEYSEEVDLPYVSVNDKLAAKTAVEHLIAQNRKRVAFINGPLRYKYAQQRLAGYIEALKAHDIPLRREYIIQLSEINSDLATSAALQLLTLDDPPDAFFTISDVYGASILRACYLSGKKVPQQVAVVGFDNLEISKILIPSLSTVNQPRAQMGFIAAENLLEKLNNPKLPNKKILLDTELIIRESSVVRFGNSL